MQQQMAISNWIRRRLPSIGSVPRAERIPNNINLVKTRGVMVTTDSDITISGLNDGEMVTFYSVNGVNLGSAKAVQGVLHFAKPNESIVIAKIKGNDLKIAIR